MAEHSEQLAQYIAGQREIRTPSNQAWARWFARSVDFLVLFEVAGLLIGDRLGKVFESLPVWAQTPVVAIAISSLATLFIVIAVEPLVLAFVGTTPGKWLMGIRIRSLADTRIGYFPALGRTAYVMTFGFALGLPYLQFIASVLGRGQLLTDGSTVWERMSGGFAWHRERPQFVWALAMLIPASNVLLPLFSQ